MSRVKTFNPYTLEDIKEYPLETLESIREKINSANEVFVNWKKISVLERVEILKKNCEYFEDHRDEIANSLTEHMGKPIWQSQNEINGFFERADYLLSIAEETLRDDELPEKENLNRKIRHEPLGVVFIIAAWNYPLMIALNGILVSLLSGNAVILKHSTVTLNIGEFFENAFGNIPGYEKLLQHIVIDHDTTSKIIEQEKIHHIIFTGSVPGGHKIYKACSKRFTDCNLELGGKDGAYVADDAGEKNAAAGLVDGAMYNAGQSCCGIERVYVHEKVYENFIEHCLEEIKGYILGDPKDEKTNIGPLHRSTDAEIMLNQIKAAENEGAKILCGGKSKIINGATFFEPTLIVNVNQKSKLIQEENFGPILPIIKVTSDEEAIELINDSEFGLTSTIFTSSTKKAEKFASHMDTGTVYMNRCDYLDPALPWTGVKKSGKGSSLSKYAFYAVTRRKALNFKVIG